MIKTGLNSILNPPVSHDPFSDGEIESYQATNPAQAEIWTTMTLLPETTLCYNECLVINWQSSVNLNVLQKSFIELAHKHPALRSTLSPDGQIQMFHKLTAKNESNFQLKVINTSSAAETTTALNQQAQNDVTQIFTLTSGAPVQLTAISENGQCTQSILTYHHIICDGESAYLLIRDLVQIYQALLSNTYTRPASVLPQPFLKATAESAAFWKNELSSIATAKTFKHLDHKERGLFRTFDSERFDLTLNSIISRGLQNTARKNQVSLFSFLLATFKVTLARQNKQNEITLGLCTSSQAENANSVGHRVIVRPMKSVIASGSLFSINLKKIDSQLMDLLEAPAIGYGELVSLIQKRSHETGTSPLFSIVFNFDQGTNLPSLVNSVKTYPRTHENFELFVNAVLTKNNEISFEAQYNKEIFTRADIAQLFNHFQTDLETVIHNNITIDITPVAPIIEAKKVVAPSAPIVQLGNDHQILATVLEIWQRRLQLSTLTAASHFFESGGHSILALEIAKEISTKFEVKFSIKDIFVNPTPQAQAAALLKLVGTIKPVIIKTEPVVEKTQTPAITATFKATTDDLTVAQQQVIFLERSQNVDALHSVPASLLVQSPVDENRFRQALTAIINQNDALRTYFKTEGGKIARKIAPPNSASDFKIEVIKSTKEEILSLLRQSAKESFDLSQWPLMKAKLCQTTCGENILYFNFHHIIWDGWCFDLFFEELNRQYVGPQPKASSLNNSYSNYAKLEQEYLKSPLGEADRAYWKKTYSTPVNRMQLPTLTNIHENAGNSASAFSLKFNDGLHAKLTNFAKLNSTSVYCILLTCFKAVLAKYSQTADIVVGVPAQNRLNDQFKNSFGYFVNTLPIRSQLNLDSSFQDLLTVVQTNFLEAIEHQQLPFFEIKRLVPDESRNDFMSALFSFQEVSQRSALFNDQPYSQINLNNNASHTPLDMWIKFSNKKIEGALQYKDQLFSQTFIENFADLYLHILETALDNSTKNVKALSISNRQKDQLLKWGTGEYKENFVTLLDYFNDSLAEYPLKVAVSCEKHSLTYSDLNTISDNIAARLKLLYGSNPTKVGVCLERTSHLPAVVMAIFKCGYTYIPLDHTFPTERLNYIVADSQMEVLITEKDILFKPHRPETKVLFLTSLIEKTTIPFRAEARNQLEPDVTAYILYTSGTTGTPKGVSVTYHNLENLVLSMQEMKIITSDDKLLAHTTICFDISFFEILVPLMTGASLHMVDKSDFLDADGLNLIVDTYGVNYFQATPSAWKILMAQNWAPNQASAKTFKSIAAGERLPQEVADYLHTFCKEVFNGYGPTETTIYSSFKNVEKNTPITCGIPVLNTQLIVLGENGEVLPPHASGELYIGGLGVSAGYYQKPELNENKFKLVTNQIMGGIFFATGDLARWNASGEIEILGRNDRQVKINGFRVELFEIESLLRKMQVFKDVHVFTLNDGAYQKIAAALCLEPGRSVSADKLRSDLSQQLPQYMIPNNFVFVDELPRTTSLKVDESALSFLVKKGGAATPSPVQSNAVAVPSINVNDKIRELWCEHLQIQEIQANRSFFELGGHSLIALNLNTHLEEILKTRIPLRFLIESKNFKEFCSKVNSLNKNSDADSKALVVLKSGLEKRNSLFCFHAVQGSALNYSVFSSYIDPDQYLVGFQTVALNGVTPMKNSIEEMAADYVEELLEFQPEGPYTLCGGSMGGTIAYEVAQQLMAKGHKIEKLIVFDTYGPDADLKNFSEPYEKTKEFIRDLIKPKRKVKAPELIDIITNKNFDLLLNYKAKPFNGDLYIIRAKRTFFGTARDPYLGWKNAIKGKIQILEIGAPHEMFIEDPEFKAAFLKFYNSKSGGA